MAEKRQKLREGFGMKLSVSDWAKKAGIGRDTLFRDLREGLTIEQAFERRGINPDGSGKPQRKPRAGKHVPATQKAVYTLLVVSGYIRPEEGPEVVTVRFQHTTKHIVEFKGSTVGVYDYKAGGMRLSGGEGLHMSRLDPAKTKIVQGERGQWFVHPDTKPMLWGAYQTVQEELGKLKFDPKTQGR